MLASSEPLGTEELCKMYDMIPREKPAVVYDAFLFNDELDMLEVLLGRLTTSSNICWHRRTSGDHPCKQQALTCGVEHLACTSDGCQSVASACMECTPQEEHIA